MQITYVIKNTSFHIIIQERMILKEWAQVTQLQTVSKSNHRHKLSMIIVDDLTLLQNYIMFYSSPRLPDLAHRSADIPQRSSWCYPQPLLYKIKGRIISKHFFLAKDSSKKRTKTRRILVKNEFICSFFGRILRLTICFRN